MKKTTLNISDLPANSMMTFWSILRTFKFTGDIYAIPEGTVIFPREPLMKIIAPIDQAQLMESALLNIVNHQCLIATKASRVVETAGKNSVMEFGLRRAQGPDARHLRCKSRGHCRVHWYK